MRTPTSPGPSLLPVTITCECRWRGIDRTKDAAVLLWHEHTVRAREGVHIEFTTTTEEG